MIPKVIHYCWFGRNPLPQLALDCIASWKKYLPDYEIKEWNEDSFDVNIIPYTAEAYKAKKYAFVSDYARFWILEQYGGVYFDTDIELIKPIDDILEQGSYLAFEGDVSRFAKGSIAPGLGLAFEAHHSFLRSMISLYGKLSFINPDGSINYKTICDYTTEYLYTRGLKRTFGVQIIDGIHLWPSEYFSPTHFVTKRLHITSNTRSIHRDMRSWSAGYNPLVSFIWKHSPECLLIWYNRLKHHKDWI